MKKTSIDRFIARALSEDMGKGDVTTSILIPKSQISSAHIVVRQKATISGLEIVKKVFKNLDKRASFRTVHSDGDTVKANTKILFIKSKTRAILTGERVALNFLSHLSGIATKTKNFVVLKVMGKDEMYELEKEALEEGKHKEKPEDKKEPEAPQPEVEVKE